MSEASAADLTPPVPVATPAPAAVASIPATGLTGGEAASGEGEGAALGQGAAAVEAPAGGAPADGAAATGDEGGAAKGAPEAYAAFVMPDGVTLEGPMLESLTSYAKAQNYTQEQAQALVDLGAQQASLIADNYLKLAAENPVVLASHWANVWSEQTASDPEIGGTRLAESMALSNRVFATFGSPELGAFLKATGIEHHPGFHHFMVKVGKAMSEDTLATPAGGPGQTAAVDRTAQIARNLYKDMN